MRPRISLILLLFALSVRCSKAKEEPPPSKTSTIVVSNSPETAPFETLWLAPKREAGSKALQSQERIPLLVVAHAWGQDIRKTDFSPLMEEASKRGWGLIIPDLHHTPGTPGMCANQETLDRIQGAVAYAQRQFPVDPERIYLTGFNTGAWVALRAAQRSPKQFAALSLWAPVGDLAHWLQELSARKEQPLTKLVEASCDLPSDPRARSKRVAQLSASTDLATLRGMKIGISVGLEDVQMISLSQSINLFERLSRINGEFTKAILPKEHEQLVRARTAPKNLHGAKAPPNQVHKYTQLFLGTNTLFLSFFDGGHEIDVNAIFSWLAKMTR